MRRWVPLVTALISLPSCHNATKETECARFVELVNGSLVEINRHTRIQGLDGPRMVTEMTKLASLYDELAAAIGRLPLSTTALSTQAEDYRRMAQSAASAARHLATAVSEADPKALSVADHEFKAVVEREAKLIEAIDAECKR